MLNLAAPTIIAATVNPVPATTRASEAIFREAAESNTPAPNDMMAAMARCGSCAMSPSSIPPSTPDAAANPQQKAHNAPVTPSGISTNRSRLFEWSSNILYLVQVGHVPFGFHIVAMDEPQRG